MPACEVIPELPFVDAGYGAARGGFLKHGGRFFFADRRRGELHCHDAASMAQEWVLDLWGERHSAAPLAFHGELLVAHGSGGLNYIDPATGRVERQQVLPRIQKLYPPIEHEGDLLYVYTNWSSGGILRFDPATGGIKWKFTKRGRTAPPRGGPAPIVGTTAIISVNDGSSLVGVDIDSGEARWTFRAQWLYTPVEISGSSMIFGTSGGWGRHLRRHDVETGETEWAVPLDGGCSYYAAEGEHLVAGDWSGVLRRIRRLDGVVSNEVPLGLRLAGPPLVVDSRIYVLGWPADGAPSLIALDA
ncbi:MAG: PQQ-binding-like beta-propeller repeat protein [Polyangiales bacterium]